MAVLEDKVAIVTGGAGGIGSATCATLALAGARVVVADIDASGASRVAESVKARGGQAVGIAVDVSNEADVRTMIDAAVGGFGRLDVLFNNAALVTDRWMAGDIDVARMDAALWDDVMAVNLRGPMLGCKHAAPHMRMSGGSIINMSSSVSLAGDLIRPAYSASKAAVDALTMHVATAYGRDGVRCNSILPGVILTAPLAANPARILGVMRDSTLLPRLGRPEDIAAAVLFLASDASSFITGQAIRVDGGLFSHVPWWGQLAGRKRPGGEVN